MDSHLFQYLVAAGEYVESGPQTPERKRSLPTLSAWLNGPHEGFPLKNFEDYLSIRGWDKAKLISGQWSLAHADNVGKSDAEIAIRCMSAVQCWLTFGFLESILGKSISIMDFTRDIREFPLFGMEEIRLPEPYTLFGNNLTRYFYTKYLVKDVGILNFQLYPMSVETIRRIFHLDSEVEILPLKDVNSTKQRAAAALEEAGNALYALNLSTLTTIRKVEVQLIYPMFLTFPTLLVESIQRILEGSLGDRPRSVNPPTLFARVQKKELVEKRGWCPFTITLVTDCTDYYVLYWLWASSLPDLSTRSHSRCMERECISNQIHSEYPIRHTAWCLGDCSKLQFQPPIGEIIRILRSGGRPLVLATMLADTASVSVVDHKPNSSRKIPYLAFSHVWADGLGSTAEVGLTACQMVHLIKICKNILNKDEVVFWIDSLCIPAEKTLRVMAIADMASIYKEASAVVVLDKTLEQVSIQGTSPEELLVRVYTSPWMQRMWPYQEGYLAESLIFRMKDGFCPLKSTKGIENMTGPLRPPTTELVKRLVYLSILGELNSFATSRKPITISTLSKAFKWRRTSKKGDSLIAAAVLLDLDVKKLMDCEEGDMMKNFLKLVYVLPKNIIFEDISRLRIENFFWAPASFPDGSPYGGDYMECGTVTCTDSGLLGDYIVFQFNLNEDNLIPPNARDYFSIYDDDHTPPTCFQLLRSQTINELTCDHILFSAANIRRSVPGAVCYAAAVLQTTDVNETQKAGESSPADLICTYQEALHLYLDFGTPPPGEARQVHGRFKKMKILLK